MRTGSNTTRFLLFASLLLACLAADHALLATEYFIGGGSATSWDTAATQVLPGDTITFRDGHYPGPLVITRSGTAAQPITIRAEHRLGATLDTTNTLGSLETNGSYLVIDGLVMDGKFLKADVLRLRGPDSHVTIRNCEIKNAGGADGAGSDGIDMIDVDNVLIEYCHVHHCLASSGGLRDDSHGIAFDSANYLTIRHTEIDHCSGDGFQVGSMHTAWDQVTIEDCVFWNSPLTTAMAGLAAGTSPAENAVDTKTRESGTSYITITRCLAYGFKNGISNQAVFNIKERVNCTLDGIVVYGSEQAFRLRTPAKATLKNCVMYGNDIGIRFESASTTIVHNTYGAAPQVALEQGDASPIPAMKNSLFLGVAGFVPTGSGNLSTTAAAAVVNAAGNDYRPKLGSPAIDSCTPQSYCLTDLPGNPRPNGALADAGAYEYGSSLYVITTGPGSGSANQPPMIDSPVSATPNPVVNASTTAVTVAAHDPDSGPAALTYTWSKVSGPGTVTFSPNGTAGASVSTATFSATGTYGLQVVVFDGLASTSSTLNGLSVTLPTAASAPTISTQPASKTVTAGQTATFSVVAGGSPLPTYQWQKNGSNISGATGASYTTPATVTGDSGSSFRVVVSNSQGTVTSSNATLTVNPIVGNPVTISVVSVSLTATPGSSALTTTTFTLTNTTGGAITVTFSESLTWLAVAPTPSTVLAAGETKTITLTGDPTGLSGVLTGTLTLTNSSGETRTVPVSYDLSSGVTSGVLVHKRAGCAIGLENAPAGDLLLSGLLLGLLATFMILRRN